MRVRHRPLLAVGATALLAGVAGALAVAPPALAADLCYNHSPTITITSAGSYSGTPGTDVVVIKHSSGTVYFDPVDGHDEICRLGTNGTFTVYAAGDGHRIGAAGPSGVTIYGSNGSDDIGGSSGNDVIKGNGGDDIIWGYGGDDYIRGNAGDDVIFDEFGDNCLLGGAGNDEISTSTDHGHNTILLGHEHRYSSYQCAPADSDNSQAATDFMNSNTTGTDLAYGGSGNDRIWGSNGNEEINAGSGNDAVRGFAGNDILWGGSGADNLNGGHGNDTLSDQGDSAGDFLYGGPGTDKFYGKSNDLCYAGWDPPSMSCTPSPVFG
jgi:Ca2+-binding RTX toxin-like protein